MFEYEQFQNLYETLKNKLVNKIQRSKGFYFFLLSSSSLDHLLWTEAVFVSPTSAKRNIQNQTSLIKIPYEELRNKTNTNVTYNAV